MIDLINEDCLLAMRKIDNDTVDMVLVDPPYGATVAKWDNVINVHEMWRELARITKDSAAILIFGNEPFSSALRMSNIKMFKYDWVWKKIERASCRERV